MKNYKTPLLAILALTLFSFSLNTSLFQKEYEDVGCIKQSILKPIQFNKSQRGTWVLLDGSEINPQSKLFELLSDNHDLDILTLKEGVYYLPDARGVFIRSSNVNGKGLDPDKNRKVGSLQTESFKKHSHNVNNAGLTHHNGRKTAKTTDNSSGENNLHSFKQMRETGGVETRPVNIAMYTYIKISN